jgi:hypothetical protein
VGGESGGGDDGHRPGVGEDLAGPVGEVVGVEGYVGGPRPGHGEDGRDHVGPGQGEGHHPARGRAGGDEVIGQCGGGPVEFGEGEALRGGGQCRGVGRAL